MKKNSFIAIAVMFIVTVSLTFSNLSYSHDMDEVFVESDNIAYAEGGYTCIPRFGLCSIPGGSITGYIKRR
jgi:hypothetical protein